MSEETKLLSDAEDFEEFKNLRHGKETPAEPAVEKTPQAEETKAEIAAEPAAAEPITQEKQEPAEKSVEDQIKELRRTGKHAQANKLMAEEAARPHREETERLRKELETLRSRPSEQPAKVEPTPAAAAPAQVAANSNDTEPKITDEKYSGADGFTLFNRDSALWAFRQENRKQQQETEMQTRRAKVTSILEAGKKAKPDFDAVISRVVLSTAAMHDGVETLGNIGDVLYKVGSDPAEIARIQALRPSQQYAELAFLSRELSNPPVVAPPLEKPKPAVTKVAAPPRVLTGSDDPPAKKLSEAEDYDDFKRLRKAKKAS